MLPRAGGGADDPGGALIESRLPTDRVSGLSGGLRCHDCTERSVSSFPIRTRVHRAKTTKQKIRRFREFFATAAGSSEGGPLFIYIYADPIIF